MKILKPVLVIAAGFILGALIWKYSPQITGKVEPWDSKGPYYPMSLFVAGAAAALMSPRHFWLAPVGVYAGQFAYVMKYLYFQPAYSAPLWPIGMVFAAIYCGLALLGGGAIFVLWRRFRKPRAEPK